MKYKKILLAATVTLFTHSNAFAQSTTNTLDLKEIQALIDNGNSAQAYSLLEPNLDRMAGDLEFDYLYGLAASDQKAYALSIMAFQRVLSLNPDFVGARLELAKAHFELDERQISKNEFLEVLAKNPPENTKKIISEYLAIIDGKNEADKEKPWNVAVGLSLGNDDNVNSATSETSYLGFNLSSNSIQTESTFNEFFAQGTYKHKLSSKNSLFISANLKNRSNADASFADTSSNSLVLGAQHLLDKSIINYGLILNTNNLDGSSNSSLSGVTTSIYEEDANGNNNIIHFRYAKIDNKLNDIQDIEQIIGGLSKSYNFDENALSLALIFGADSPEQANSPYGKLIVGTRVGFSTQASEELIIAANAGVVYSNYTGEFNGQERSDTSISFGINAQYKFDKQWTASAEFNSINNKSDIDLYTFDRSFFLTKVTWSY